MSAIPSERLRQLATVARRSTPRALRQMAPERRHPILLAALAAVHTEIVDETVRLFDMALASTDNTARSDDQRLPRDGGHLELLEARFSHVRSFAPHVLAALTFAASVSPSEVLDAVILLQAMNDDGRRHVPENAPVEFVPARWGYQ